MKHSLISIASALGLLASLAAQGGDFTPIFNGKDLSGWKSNEETPGCFSVEDGAIKVSGGRAHLFYMGSGEKAEFGDFELKLKIKTLPKANGGVYFHTQFENSGWPTKGFECQVNNQTSCQFSSWQYLSSRHRQPPLPAEEMILFTPCATEYVKMVQHI